LRLLCFGFRSELGIESNGKLKEHIRLNSNGRCHHEPPICPYQNKGVRG
jgi:hypothetical protein